jgi:peptidoglycan/xylan/chitin deacetylase (PgdA/CDA1 family)
VGCHSHFHAPLVSLTDGAGHDDSRVLQVIQECGYQNVHWNVEPQDWLEDKTPESVTSSIIDGVEALEADGVVLLHTWPRATVEALPVLIAELRKRDFRLVRVDDAELQI